MFWCNHKWKVSLKTYKDPATPPIISCSEAMWERCLMGLTTILLECEKCHKTRKEEMLGKEV